MLSEAMLILLVAILLDFSFATSSLDSLQDSSLDSSLGLMAF